MQPIISADELLEALQTGNILLVDATSGPAGRAAYQREHISGAVYVDLEHDLSKIGDPAKGGRHPLPEPARFSGLLSGIGLTEERRVVVYDRASGTNAAARFWWMMRAAGHRAVQVLDGGFGTAKAKGLPMAAGIEGEHKGSGYSFGVWQLPTVDIEDVTSYTKRPEETLIIDVREEARYAGQREPIDLVAGHIPTAVNIPLANNLQKDGLFKSPDELRKLYGPFFDQKQSSAIAVHCGSGVSACHTLLALDYAGFDIPALYVGSWSEWSRNDKPIGTGNRG